MPPHQAVPSSVPPFLALPPEIREQIYSTLLRSANNRVEATNDPYPDRQKERDEDEIGPTYKFDLRVLRVCHQIYDEAKKIWRKNVFVKVTTGWEKAIQHVNVEGNVGLVLRDNLDPAIRPARDFQNFHLRALVESPAFHLHTNEMFSLVTCFEDVEAYARIWQFSHLNSGRGLNPHLSLRLDLMNPYDPYGESSALPKSLQQRLLLPFGKVKDLLDTTFDFHKSPFFPSGLVDPAVRSAILAQQTIPAPTPSECLERCNNLLQSGKALFEEGIYDSALSDFMKAFEHIHIFNHGRHREIHCDHYYTQDDILSASTPFKGQNASGVRMCLRLELVLYVVKTYIQSRAWSEAYFWGKRSIRAIRRSMDETDEIGGREWDAWVTDLQREEFGGREDLLQLFVETEDAGRKVMERGAESGVKREWEHGWEELGDEEGWRRAMGELRDLESACLILVGRTERSKFRA